jgi:hypothetical protein
MEAANGHLCREFWSESPKAIAFLNKHNFAVNEGSIVRENYFGFEADRYLAIFPCNILAIVR